MDKTTPKNYLDLEIKDDNPQWVKFVDHFNQRREEKFNEPGYFEYKNRFDDIHIISKKMQFVEWLVAQGYIDLIKLTCTCIRHTDILDLDYSWCDRLLMILAIQDNPITFILKCLK
jgi:hypothetical protein